MVNLAEIRAAQERIRSIVLKTPVLEDPALTGLRFKAEHLQRTGSFKLRGAAKPSGATSVAAALRAGGKAVAVVTGGNLDLANLTGVPAWMP